MTSAAETFDRISVDEMLVEAARPRDATAGSELLAGHEVVGRDDPWPGSRVFAAGHPVALGDVDQGAPGRGRDRRCSRS